MDDLAPGVALSDAIEYVRTELEKATASGAKSSIAFRPESIELEFDVVFDVSGGTDVGLRVWVISLGAKAEISRSQTQHLKIVLTPVDRETNLPHLVSDVGDQ